jgi:hypothetical protein
VKRVFFKLRDRSVSVKWCRWGPSEWWTQWYPDGRSICLGRLLIQYFRPKMGGLCG